MYFLYASTMQAIDIERLSVANLFPSFSWHDYFVFPRKSVNLLKHM